MSLPEKGGGEWRHTGTRPYEAQAEAGRVLPQAKQHLMPPEAGTGEGFSPRTSRENMALWTP